MKIALDFDGTIADTMTALEQLAVDVLCPKFMLEEEFVRTQYRKTAGDPFFEQLKLIYPVGFDYEMASAAAQYEYEKRGVTLSAKPFTEVDTALAALAEKEHELHIVSSTETDLIQAWVDLQDLDHFVTVWGLHYGYKLEQLQRCEAELFIGDSDLDRVRADARRIRFAGICRNPHNCLLSADNRDLRTLDDVEKLL